LCLLFGLVSLIASQPGQAAGNEGGQMLSMIAWLQPSFIALVNTFVLYGAVLGAAAAVSTAG
jgi:hypothetical protein